MTVIIPQLTQIQELTVTGMSVRTKNEEEFNPQTARLPQLWEKFFDSNIRAQQEKPTYGVYHHYDSDSSGYYTVTAGIEIVNESKATNLDRVTIKAATIWFLKQSVLTPQQSLMPGKLFGVILIKNQYTKEPTSLILSSTKSLMKVRYT